MSFAREMKEIGLQLGKLAHEVRLPEFMDQYLQLDTSEEMHNEAVKNKLNNDLFRIYYDLIKENDAILIVNKNKKGISGYIGGNGLIEMSYAHILKKKIYLLNPIPDMPYTDELTAMKPIILNKDLTKI